MKIGAMVESFRAGLERGLQAAREVGADGVQIFATGGEVSPSKLSREQRAALRRRLADMDLELAALCGDFGGHGFTVESDNPKRIDDSCRIMDLALDLGCRVVTTHVGVIPADAAHPRYAVLKRACVALGRYGERAGATFAIETGPEPAAVLRSFLEDVGCPRGLGVNFDPANLAMVIAEDIPAAAATLGPWIVHTHAKDGLQLKPVDPEQLYDAFARGGIEGFHATDYIREVPLGQGAVPWSEYLAALRAADYDGYLTIEREVGDDPRRDIEQAVRFLRAQLGEA
jgi:sugar phosphate isomerase/epimerase